MVRMGLTDILHLLPLSAFPYLAVFAASPCVSTPQAFEPDLNVLLLIIIICVHTPAE